MDEEIDTRKINNSFLRDHNYATEADIISTVEFNSTGELLATGDKGGRVVVFQREQEVIWDRHCILHNLKTITTTTITTTRLPIM
uniref:Uncharacterized protein n=1 Tax=Sinocyclocheilus anshuiensis TaxID=1608454 RepID=A0A671KVA2_9TELE